MTLEQIMAAILGFNDMPALVAQIKDKARAQLYQPIFNDGHGVATAEFAKKEAEFNTRIAALETAKNEAVQKLEQWKKDNPGEAKIREEYEQKLLNLQNEHKKAIEARDAADQATAVERTQEALIDKLEAMGVDPLHAKALVRDDAVKNRIKPDPKTGVKLMQANSDIPLAEPDPKKALKLLADELFKGVPDKYIESGVKRGSSRGTPAGPGNNSSKDEDLVDEIQADVAAKFGRSTDADGETRSTRTARDNRSARDRLSERLGLAR